MTKPMTVRELIEVLEEMECPDAEVRVSVNGDKVDVKGVSFHDGYEIPGEAWDVSHVVIAGR